MKLPYFSTFLWLSASFILSRVIVIIDGVLIGE
jgi:hypothetical protein